MLYHFNVVTLKLPLPQEQLHAAEHCLDEESTIEKVLVISAVYDYGAFRVTFYNTPYLSSSLNGRHVGRSSLHNQRREPAEPFSFWIHRYPSANG